MKQARDFRPGDRLVHPVSGEVLTVTSLTEFNPPAEAGLPGEAARVRVTVREWSEGQVLLLDPVVLVDEPGDVG